VLRTLQQHNFTANATEPNWLNSSMANCEGMNGHIWNGVMRNRSAAVYNEVGACRG
jgi:hypothetical protein